MVVEGKGREGKGGVGTYGVGWGGGGSMCDGGWGLVCPEAHEAAAADVTLLRVPGSGQSSRFF